MLNCAGKQRGMHKKPGVAGFCVALFLDRGLVCHRTAVKLSFARLRSKTTDNCRLTSGETRGLPAAEINWQQHRFVWIWTVAAKNCFL
jgi:hypothetical protein